MSTKRTRKLKRAIKISNIETLEQLRNESIKLATAIEVYNLHIVEIAYKNPAYISELKQIHDTIAPTAVILKGFTAFLDREDNINKNTLEVIPETKVDSEV